MLADKGRRRFVRRHPFDLAVGIDPDDRLQFGVLLDVAAGLDLEGLVGQLPELLLASEFGQEVEMAVQAVLEGPFGPVHVAFQGGTGGVQFAPLEQGGNDQHGQCEGTDCDVRGKPQPVLL